MNSDSGKIISQAAIDVCWQNEQWAHAEFWHGMSSAQRAELGRDGRFPWRGIMSPAIVRLIDALEAAGLYDAGSLTEPRASTEKLAVYAHSPYDYDVARRVEAGKAECKWNGEVGK